MAGAPDTAQTELSALVNAAREMAEPGSRRFLGITGAPGSGKSTLAEHIATALGSEAVLVSLDGFHLADPELRRLGRHERKGSPDTFDVAGYVNLLRRLRHREDAVVYAPVFDRTLEAGIAGAVPVSREAPLVITEGNYLLLPDQPWLEIAELLDVIWYVDPGEDVRVERLIARHVAFGRTLAAARERSLGSDQQNAQLITATRDRAHRVVRPPHLPDATMSV